MEVPVFSVLSRRTGRKHHFPIYSIEEWVRFQFLYTIHSRTKPFLRVVSQQLKDEIQIKSWADGIKVLAPKNVKIRAKKIVPKSCLFTLKECHIISVLMLGLKDVSWLC